MTDIVLILLKQVSLPQWLPSLSCEQYRFLSISVQNTLTATGLSVISEWTSWRMLRPRGRIQTCGQWEFLELLAPRRGRLSPLLLVGLISPLSKTEKTVKLIHVMGHRSI